MRKILLTIAGILVVAIAGLLAFAATKPDVFEVQRTASIKAPPEKIFPLINNMRSFVSWSPFEKDPQMKREYSGAESGSGAAYEWDGNKDVGAGRVAIADTSPPTKVVMQLDMFRPIEAHNLVHFTLEPQGDVTKVTWAMQGKVPYFAKVVHVVIDMDKMVGGEFEKGLNNLKAIAEK